MWHFSCILFLPLGLPRFLASGFSNFLPCIYLLCNLNLTVPKFSFQTFLFVPSILTGCYYLLFNHVNKHSEILFIRHFCLYHFSFFHLFVARSLEQSN
jgi:hypothetical protein